MQGAISTTPIVIEYRRRRPFAVAASELSLDHNGEEQTHITYHDFEYCRRNDILYQHMSGCGGDGKTYNLGKFCKPGIHAEIWAAPDVVFTKTIKRKRKYVDVPAKESDLAKLGYRRLKQPRLVKGSWGDKSRDPFEVSDEGETVYCPRCDDWMLDEEVTDCRHLQWCDECSEHVDVETGLTVDFDAHPCEHREAAQTQNQ